MTVAIVTDTTHYLPDALVAAYDIHRVSLYVRWDEDVEAEGSMADYDAFYDRLRVAATIPATSQPSVGDFLAIYEPLLAQGRSIVSIHLSSGISGTCDTARQAADELAARGHAGKIEVYDSQTAAGGIGLVALAAAKAARDGGGMNEVLAAARAARAELHMWFCVDTLEYLRRGGRIGAAQAWVGGALKIKPILSVEAEITPVERVRTASRAFERMVDYLRSIHDGGQDGWVVQHIQADDTAARLLDRGREIFGTEPVWVGEVGPVIGAHVGPGLVGVGGIPRSMVE